MGLQTGVGAPGLWLATVGIATLTITVDIPAGTTTYPAGVEPDPLKRPELAKALLFGPLSPIQFRMDGHDKLPDAAARFAETVAAFGCVTNLQFDTHELRGLEILAGNLKKEKWLAELLGKVR